MLAGLVASWLLPIIGWRYLFLVGLSPLVLVFMIRYWVPESPRWLIRMGRREEARKSLAWALMMDPKEIDLPAALPELEKTRWLDLFKYPRLVAAGCLTGLTQTGGASLGLWGATLLVIVLNTTPAHAAFLMVWVGLSGILGRFFITTLIEPLGRRGAGTLACGMAALLMVLQGYFYNVFIGGWSLFYLLFLTQTFFGSAIYTVVGPYMSEIWPARLRSSGMGMSYGVAISAARFWDRRPGGDHGGRRHHQAGGAEPRHARPCLHLFRILAHPRIIGFWVFGPKPRAARSRRWTARSIGRPPPRPGGWRKPPATDPQGRVSGSASSRRAIGSQGRAR